jgi:AsmA protein
MHPTDNQTDQDSPPTSRGRTRLIVLLCLLLVFVVIAFLPPLVNVSRFQKRIASNISAALGRPVHFDSVALTLIPLPGFTLKNFVVDEDPAFGYEPILRADQVQVTLRISSLWHPHIEFSKIAFTEPSVNLVHSANGKWNVESLLLQASHLQAAPTGQRFAGPARRFPYIEATGARLNLKLGQEKTPVSLTDTDFALWLPEPHQWHLRLEAHPTRTDTDPGDTGTIRAEGTLGGGLSAASLAQVPIDFHGDWRDAQLGGLSRLLIGHDPGLRGDFSLSFDLLGTIDHNTITTNIKLTKARRADFVPNHLLSLEAACSAVASDTFHSFTSIQCQSPPAESSAFSNSSAPTLLVVTASVPSVSDPRSASATLTLPALPADTLFDWLSVATPHPPTVLEGAGSLTGTLNWGAPTPSNQPAHNQTSPTQPALYGQLELSGASIATDPDSNRSIPLGDVLLRSTPSAGPPPARSRHARPPLALPPVPNSFDLLPVMVPLGGKQPATVEGHFDSHGYSLHLTGNVIYARLLELAKAFPQFGDGLNPFLDKIAANNPETTGTPDADPHPIPASATSTTPTLPTAPIPIDFTATRTWGGPQVWTKYTPPAPTRPARYSR